MSSTASPSDSLIIFDTETTGLIANSARPLKEQPQIIELFALKLDAKTIEPISEWHSLFWVKDLPVEITKITSITKEMLRDAPKFALMVDSLSDFFLGTRHLGGHNISFDIDMLILETKRMGLLAQFPWPPKRICTVEATETLEGFRLGLSALHEKLFGVGFSSAHRAKADVEATARCLKKLVEEGIIKL